MHGHASECATDSMVGFEMTDGPAAALAGSGLACHLEDTGRLDCNKRVSGLALAELLQSQLQGVTGVCMRLVGPEHVTVGRTLREMMSAGYIPEHNSRSAFFIHQAVNISQNLLSRWLFEHPTFRDEIYMQAGAAGPHDHTQSPQMPCSLSSVNVYT